MKRYDAIIIGAGAVGCAISYVLAQYDISIAVIERNPDVAMGTSGKNSAVVHAGFNNKPGSLMAKLCVEGNKEFEQICKLLDVPYKKTGKLVIAFNDEEMAIVDRIINHGKENDCIGLSRIDRARMDELEPNIGGVGAMYSANTAVIDPFIYNINLCEATIQNGVDFFMNSEVTDIRRENGRFIIIAGPEEFNCSVLINSAGLYSDVISGMAGDEGYKIYPCRGEYLILDTFASELVSRPIYPVPHSGVGGLGVHLTTSIDNNMLIGPSAEYVEDNEDYDTTQHMMDNLFYEAQQLLPLLRRDMIIGAYTGIRPKLVAKGQGNFGDFVIEESSKVENLINLIGIESPGLTASIPIGRMVAEIIGRKRPLNKKSGFKRDYKSPVCFAKLDIDEQNRLISQNPDYGEIICRCKMVSKAEVIQALNNTLGAHSIVSIKNRLHVTRGRCQGGYCLTRIADIIMKEMDISVGEIAYRHEGDKLFQGWLKV